MILEKDFFKQGALDLAKELLGKTIVRTVDGRILKEGINTVILGKPNAGKSSLLNVLVGTDRAIVTDIAGTTRDVLEEQINLGGITLNLVDTAGIRNTEDIVEKIGVNKSLELIDNSDLILYVLNNNEEISLEDIELLEKIKDKNHIVIINKTDLESKLDLNIINDNNIIKMSIKDNIGINELKERIRYNEKQLLKSRSYSEYEFYMKQIDYYKEKLNKIKGGE